MRLYGVGGQPPDLLDGEALAVDRAVGEERRRVADGRRFEVVPTAEW
ncbi:hypothetical protein AB0L14_31325 [Streptomyces sp. NPDC052727]